MFDIWKMILKLGMKIKHMFLRIIQINRCLISFFITSSSLTINRSVIFEYTANLGNLKNVESVNHLKNAFNIFGQSWAKCWKNLCSIRYERWRTDINRINIIDSDNLLRNKKKPGTQKLLYYCYPRLSRRIIAIKSWQESFIRIIIQIKRISWYIKEIRVQIQRFSSNHEANVHHFCGTGCFCSSNRWKWSMDSGNGRRYAHQSRSQRCIFHCCE